MVLRFLRGADRGVTEALFVEIEEVHEPTVVTADTLSKERTSHPQFCHDCPMIPLMVRAGGATALSPRLFRSSRRSRQHESGGSSTPPIAGAVLEHSYTGQSIDLHRAYSVSGKTERVIASLTRAKRDVA